MRKAFFFITIFFLCNLSFIPTQSKIQQSNDDYVSYPTSPVYFSINPNQDNSYVEVYSVFLDNSMINLLDFSVSVFGISNRTGYTIPIANFLNSNSTITDINYFISNNNRFLAISNSFNGIQYFTIKNLDTNQEISFSGNSIYSISLLTSFKNSKDIYFAFYNVSMFLIAKYSFTNDNFSIFSQTNNLVYSSSYLSNVNSFNLNNKIYTSMIIHDNKNAYFHNSTVLIFNSNENVFNRTFVDFSIDFFSPTNYGLLLHSQTNGSFYAYSFKYDNYLPSKYSLIIEGFLEPFNNDSFIVLSSEHLFIRQYNTFERSITMHDNYFNTYFSTNLTNPKLYAFNTQGMNFYVIGGKLTSSFNYVISFNQDFNSPRGFEPTTTVDSVTNPIVYSQNKPNQFLIFAVLGILVVIIVGFIAIFVIDNKKRKRNQYNVASRDTHAPNLYYNNTNRNTIEKNEYYYLPKYCIDCGSKIEYNDVFCQNCGKRI